MDEELVSNQINIREFTPIKELNKGGFGVVFLVKEKSTKKLYAAKVNILDVSDKEDYTKCVLREIKILANVNFPTIVGFRGYSLKDFDDDPNVTILLDFVKKGSLMDVLKEERTHPSIDNTTRQIILCGVAHGMMILHSLNIIHRDLKPGNVLIDDNYRPLITDFGMSKYFDPNNPHQQSTWGGTPLYEAPEIWRGEDYDTSVDVYAYGLLMYEVVTGKQPFSELVNVNKAKFRMKVVRDQYRPPFSVPVKEPLKEIIQNCWSNNPNERPSFEEIYNALNLTKSNKYCFDGVNVAKVKEYVDHLNNSGASADSELMRQLRSEISFMRRKMEKLHLDNERFRTTQKKIDPSLHKSLFKTSQNRKESDCGILSKLRKKELETDIFDPLFIPVLSSRDPYNILLPNWKGFYTSSTNGKFFLEIQLRDTVNLTGILIQSDEKGTPRSYTIYVNEFKLLSIKDDQSMLDNRYTFHDLGKSVSCSRLKFVQDGKNWDGKNFIRIRRIEFFTNEYPLKSQSLRCKGLFANMKLLYRASFDPHRFPVHVLSDTFSCEDIQNVKTEQLVGTDHALKEFCEINFTKGLVKVDSYRLKRTEDSDKLKGWDVVGTTENNDEIVISSINETKINEHNLIDYYPSSDNETLFKSIKIVNTTNNWNGDSQNVLRFHHIDFFGEYFTNK